MFQSYTPYLCSLHFAHTTHTCPAHPLKTTPLPPFTTTAAESSTLRPPRLPEEPPPPLPSAPPHGRGTVPVERKKQCHHQGESKKSVRRMSWRGSKDGIGVKGATFTYLHNTAHICTLRSLLDVRYQTLPRAAPWRPPRPPLPAARGRDQTSPSWRPRGRGSRA